jgi:hypothetical protein
LEIQAILCLTKVEEVDYLETVRFYYINTALGNQNPNHNTGGSLFGGSTLGGMMQPNQGGGMTGGGLFGGNTTQMGTGYGGQPTTTGGSLFGNQGTGIFDFNLKEWDLEINSN